VVPFLLLRALPSGVRGPVLFRAFARFAAIWASVAMTFTLGMVLMRDADSGT
jgi:hypothetical protein